MHDSSLWWTSHENWLSQRSYDRTITNSSIRIFNTCLKALILWWKQIINHWFIPFTRKLDWALLRLIVADAWSKVESISLSSDIDTKLLTAEQAKDLELQFWWNNSLRIPRESEHHWSSVPSQLYSRHWANYWDVSEPIRLPPASIFEWYNWMLASHSDIGNHIPWGQHILGRHFSHSFSGGVLQFQEGFQCLTSRSSSWNNSCWKSSLSALIRANDRISYYRELDNIQRGSQADTNRVHKEN